MFNTIVVGLDGSETSHTALRLACDLAGKYDADLHLVHTPQPKTVAFAMGAVAGYHTATTMPHADEVQAAGNKILDQGAEIAAEMGRTVTGKHQQLGEPADVIIGYAQGCDADLIVTGRRGLGSISALVQGSTTQRVNHLAQCACLSVV
ncbi:universal stress protein [uncultured Tateyamaria sp.]|uniref:universal stress protein n=1 Tax=uncultured Tateyamaria sp. TaxID=455651 RepID=UPI00261FC08B|nr:universal stress protein [uncultured Tateyamaria sp.]